MARTGRSKTENSKKKVLSISVEDAVYSRLLSYAEQYHMTVTEVVLQGLKEGRYTQTA